MNNQRNHFLSDEFVKKLADFSAGFISSEDYDQLIELLQSEASKYHFNRSSESNLLRIISSMYDKYSFLNDCIKYPHYIEIITAAASNSNYLSDILVRNPEYFYWIANRSNLEVKLNYEELKKYITSAIISYKSFTSKVNFLRNLKRKEMLRIGIRDILSIANLETITEELSILAKVITAKLFKLSLDEILLKYKVKKTKSKYCLIALGKLGGFELNYSSDIDLIIFYDENRKIKNKYFNEVLTEAIYLFIESAASISADGFIYRVDFRLRPDGRNSPLCRSINEYLSYYESRGEDWERQMLIKAGFIGGDYELYQKFISYVTPFIYPSSFSVSPTEQIIKLKRNIEKNNGDSQNIKLHSGGIRDIEFSVQALQLINGGRIREIRTGSTIAALKALEENGLLSHTEADLFYKSYILYRKIEHYLQLMNDKQTHTIPLGGEILEKMSAYLKFKTSKNFLLSVNKTCNSVTKVYQSIMGKEVEVKEKRTLADINFENKRKAEQDFIYLREGKGLLGQKEFDQRTILAFHQVEKEIINYLVKATNPDITLQNFVRVIKHSSIPFVWFKELSDKKFLDTFLHICEYSQKAIDLAAEDDDLIELFLNRRAFENIDQHSVIQYELKRLQFMLSVQFTLNLINHLEVSSVLTLYLRERIRSVIINLFDKKNEDVTYFAAILGSLGTGETTFNSDVDIIFVIDENKNLTNSEKLFQIILSQIKTDLPGVEVDCRLRPEGKSGSLVWDLKNYQKYINNRLRIWELQAFTKISFLSGSKVLFNKFIHHLASRADDENKFTIAKEIREMRHKLYPAGSAIKSNFINIKKSPGGLLDIEFLLQYLMLYLPKNFLHALGKNVEQLFEYFRGQLGTELSEKLYADYYWLKRLDMLNQTVFNTTTSIIPSDKNKLNMLAKKMSIDSGDNLVRKINNIMISNKQIFQKYLSVK